MTEPKDFPPYHNAETWKIAQERALEATKPVVAEKAPVVVPVPVKVEEAPK